MKRSSTTIRVMKKLFPDKRLQLQDLSLTTKELQALKRDRKKYGGFSSTYNGKGAIDTIWLSSEGKRFIAAYIKKHQYAKRAKDFLVNNYKWLISIIIALLGASGTWFTLIKHR